MEPKTTSPIFAVDCAACRKVGPAVDCPPQDAPRESRAAAIREGWKEMPSAALRLLFRGRLLCPECVRRANPRAPMAIEEELG